jgi:hypothetical protein
VQRTGRYLQCTNLGVEFGQALRCADVYPQALVVFTADFAECDLCAQHWGERGLAAARDICEQRRLVQADSAEGQG